MNLDDSKSLFKRVTAPADAPSVGPGLDGFITAMRARDQQQRRRALGTALVLVPLGLVLMASGASRRSGSDVIGLGIIMSAAYICLKAHGFGRVDYAAPADQFLAAAARRYRFLGMKDVVAIVPLLVMGLGGALTVYDTACRYWQGRGDSLALGGYLVFFVVLCLFALGVSRKNWHRETASLLEEIHRRQQDLENG